MENIVICPECRARMVAEEVANHQCDRGYKIEGNILWLRSRHDGLWKKYILPRHHDGNTPNKHHKNQQSSKHYKNPY